jgi:endonuclease YncB( thermonuclease family)
MNKIVLSIVVTASVLSLSLSAQTISGKVIKVADGDTLTMLDASNVQHKIRLAQIDAPEKSQEYGIQSKQSLENTCFNSNADAEVETVDKYNRKVAIIYCNGVEANFNQVQNGSAWVYVQYAKDKKYFDAELKAKKQHLGLWEGTNPTPPWEYRRGQKDISENKPVAEQDPVVIVEKPKKHISHPTEKTQSQPKRECRTKSTCSQMSSCAEARFYLEQCRNTRLDRDHDGVPCEKICR